MTIALLHFRYQNLRERERMGVCSSTPSEGTKISSGKAEIRSEQSEAMAEKIRRLSSVVRVVNAVDGGLQEYKAPVKGRHVTSAPGSFLCSSEHMSVGTCPPRVADEEDLSPAQIYFLLPEAKAQRPISLPELCSLAIKASSALGKSGVDFSSGNRKLTGLR